MKINTRGERGPRGSERTQQTLRRPTTRTNRTPQWRNLRFDARRIRWLGPLYVFDVFWYRLHYNVVRWKLSFTWLFAVIILIFSFTLRRIRFAISSNLEVVLGRCNWFTKEVRIYKTLWNWSWCRTEQYEHLQPEADRPPVTMRSNGHEHWLDLIEEGRGLIVLASHIGSFGSAFILPKELLKHTLHVVRAPEPDPEADAFMSGLVEEACGGNLVTHFLEDDDTGLGVTLLGALRRGEAVALTCDRSLNDSNMGQAEIFGRPIALPMGPVILARLAQVPLLPVFLFYEGRRKLRFEALPPIEVPRTADRDADHAAALREVATCFQWGIEQEPFQWCCFREMWPQPRPEKSSAG